MKLPIAYPFKPSKITQPFGVNWGANYPSTLGVLGHPGIDLIIEDAQGNNASLGYSLLALCDGVVSSLEIDTAGGYTVVMVTNQKFDYQDGETYFKMIYAHTIPGSWRVAVGESVSRGQVIALCGSSGASSIPNDASMAHLHWGLKPVTLMPASGDEPAWWENTFADNGYQGAIDPAPYWDGTYAEEPLPQTPAPSPEITNTAGPSVVLEEEQEVGLIAKIISFLAELIQKVAKNK